MDCMYICSIFKFHETVFITCDGGLMYILKCAQLWQCLVMLGNALLSFAHFYSTSREASFVKLHKLSGNFRRPFFTYFDQQVNGDLYHVEDFIK